VTPAESWLRSRLPDAPAHLLEAMVAAPAEGESVADALAAAAIALYREVVRGTGGREDAFPLLVADALFTHAFQAQAEQDPHGLLAFADRWSDLEGVKEVAW
jgi:hypothetical protein